MITSAIPYPAPVRSDINAPMLDAWKQGELHLQQCGVCDHKVYFPRTQCPHCWSVDLRWMPLSGRGKIVSYATVHKHVHPSFALEAPTILAEIRLDEGWTILARIIADEPNSVESGTLVELVGGQDAQRYPLPTFCPRP